MFSDFFAKQLQTPGDRIKALRNSLGISRKEFSLKHGFSDATLNAIEQSIRHLTSAQLHRLIDIFNKEGLYCSEECIMTGEGAITVDEQGSNADSPSAFDPIVAEVNFFQKQNPSALLVQIEDENMAPLYQKQDYVGGIKVARMLKSTDYGQPYIVTLSNNTKLVRTVYPGQQKGLFNLVSLNLLAYLDQPFHTDVTPKEIHKIIWHRKRF